MNSAEDDFSSSNGIKKEKQIIDDKGNYILTYINDNNEKVTEYHTPDGRKYAEDVVLDNAYKKHFAFYENGKLAHEECLDVMNNSKIVNYAPDGIMRSFEIIYASGDKLTQTNISNNRTIEEYYDKNGVQLFRKIKETETDEILWAAYFNEDGSVSVDNSSNQIANLKKEINLRNIQKIDEDNVINVLIGLVEKNDDKTVTTLSEKIASSSMSDVEKREALRHIAQNLFKYAQNEDNKFAVKFANEKILPLLSDENFDIQKVSQLVKIQQSYSIGRNCTPNGIFDEDFFQGTEGDCWFLATVQSLRNTPEGLQILDDTVDIDDATGNVIVKFKGINKTFVITPDELMTANELSQGDLDVRAMELALRKYFKEEKPNGKADINGNSPKIAMKILTGEDACMSMSNLLFCFKEEDFQNGLFVASTKIDKSLKDIKAETIDGEKVNLVEQHSYSVKNYDNEYVYLVNPHNTAKTIKMPITQYFEYFESLSISLLPNKEFSKNAEAIFETMKSFQNPVI